MTGLSLLEQTWRSEGFAVWPMRDGTFIPCFARVWFLTRDATHHFRVELAPRHLNGFGLVHGGFLSTMADIWLGYNVASRLEPSERIVTTTLAVDFVRSVRTETWLHSEIDRLKVGKRICFASGVIHGSEEPIAHMRASFSVFDASTPKGRRGR